MFFVFFCKQKTAYEMRISDWSSDVCSSDLRTGDVQRGRKAVVRRLAAIDVVVRVARRLAAARAGENLVGAARAHLVGVHVALRAAAGLPDDERELAVEPTRGESRAGLFYGVGPLAGKPVCAFDTRPSTFSPPQRVTRLSQPPLRRAQN